MARRKPEREEQESFGLRADPLMLGLHKVIRFAVRMLAVLMVLVILWGVADVVWVLYQQVSTPPVFLLNFQDVLSLFGAFLTVLIAIEIFVNITLYLRDDVIHVKLVVATALMAIARKVIVFDYAQLSARYIWGTAAVVLALGLTYWLLSGRGADGRGLAEGKKKEEDLRRAAGAEMEKGGIGKNP